MSDFQYTELEPADVQAIKAETLAGPPAPDPRSFVKSWEADHAAHDALCKAQVPHPDDCPHDPAMREIEAAIAAVLAV